MHLYWMLKGVYLLINQSVIIQDGIQTTSVGKINGVFCLLLVNILAIHQLSLSNSIYNFGTFVSCQWFKIMTHWLLVIRDIVSHCLLHAAPSFKLSFLFCHFLGPEFKVYCELGPRKNYNHVLTVTGTKFSCLNVFLLISKIRIQYLTCTNAALRYTV